MNDSTEVKEVSKSISADFIRNGVPAIINKIDFENINELKIYLTGKLTIMLDNNYDKLLNTLYLIDINEDKLRKVFSSSNKEFIPSQLADLIIERELQKFYFRQKYKKDKNK